MRSARRLAINGHSKYSATVTCWQFTYAASARATRSLPQRDRETASEAGHLISKAGASVEVEVPSVARKPPVTDVGDQPVGRRLDFNDEIHAATIWAVELASAEDHLTARVVDTDLPRREPERDQDRIEGPRNQVRITTP